MTPQPMEISVFEPRWSADVVELWTRAGLTRPWNDPQADLAYAVDGLSSDVLVGVLDGRLVATVMIGHDGHRGWVYYLAVDPGVQKRGHGRAMMDAAQAWLRERGVPKLNVMVRSSNRDVVGFYRSLGLAADDVVVLGRRLDRPID